MIKTNRSKNAIFPNLQQQQQIKLDKSILKNISVSSKTIIIDGF